MSKHAMIVINQRQLAWLTASIITAGGLISVQHELVRISRVDAWFTYIASVLYTLLIAFVFMQMTLRFPGKNMFEIILIIFGKWAGGLVTVVLVAHMWLLLMRDLASMGKFIGTILLPNTPQEFIVLLFMLLLMFYGRTSVEVVARVNDLFYPFFVGLALLLPLLLANELDKHLVQPVLTGDPLKLVYANFISAGWYGDVFIMGAFLHTIASFRQIHSALRHGAVVATGLLTVYIFLEIVVLGPEIPGNLIYPVYTLVQHIHITDFLDRIDLVMLSIWYPITACKIIVIYLSFLTAIASLVRERDYTLINTPVGLLVLLTTLLAFKSTTEIFNFGNFSSPFLLLLYQPLLFAALMLRLLRFKKVQQVGETLHSGDPSLADPSAGGADFKNGGGRQSKTPWLLQVSYTAWRRLTSGFLLAGLGLVALGIAMGAHYAPLSIACGYGYGLCLLLAIVCSHMELEQSKKFTIKKLTRPS